MSRRMSYDGMFWNHFYQDVAQIKKVLFIKYIVRLHYIAFFIKDLDCLKGKRLQRRRRNVCSHYVSRHRRTVIHNPRKIISPFLPRVC